MDYVRAVTPFLRAVLVRFQPVPPNSNLAASEVKSYRQRVGTLSASPVELRRKFKAIPVGPP